VAEVFNKYGEIIIMKILSSEEYQDRINPWLNKHVNVAHSIPVAFPRFRSIIANEAFLFVLTMVLFVVIYVVISILFSSPGMSSNTSVIENIEGTFRNPKALILFSLVYLRAAYFILSRLNHELLVAVAGFLLMMLIALMAIEMPALEAWLDGSPMQYSAPAVTTLAAGALMAYVLTRKLLRQFHEAKNKPTARGG